MAACHIMLSQSKPAGFFHPVEGIHCKKKVSGFPAPSRDVTYQTLPGKGVYLLVRMYRIKKVIT